MTSRSLSRPGLALPALLVAALVPRPAPATTYVMMTDHALVDQATTVVRVTIEGVAMAPELAATDYTARVERILKGAGLPSRIVIRVPGGESPEGPFLKVWGAPQFAVGDRALLFLDERRDGTWTPLHLMLGAFQEIEAGGRRLAVRDLSEATEVRLPGRSDAPSEGKARDLDRFSDWIVERAAGREGVADYFVADPESALERATEPFTLIVFGNGLPARWFEFDTGKSVAWRLNPNGLGVLPNSGADAVQNSIAAWNADPDTPIDYRYTGTTSAAVGFNSFDNINAILPGDPNGEVGGTFNCQTGGVLGIGGPWVQGTKKFNDKTYNVAIGADVILQDGIDCFLNDAFVGAPAAAGGGSGLGWVTGAAVNVKGAEELLGHELGHTLALSHACGDTKTPPCASDPDLADALMAALARNDGRGARLGVDDKAAIRELYARAGTAPTPDCLDGPNTIRIDDKPGDGRFRICITFSTSQGGGKSGAGNPIGLGSLGISRGIVAWFFGADNPEVLLKVLNACGVDGHFWAFISAGTNVGMNITIVDTKTGKTKTYTNADGKAFQSVQDTSFFTCN